MCRWVAFRGVLSDGKGRGTVTDLMRRFNKCQTSALIKPGSNSVKASNDMLSTQATQTQEMDAHFRSATLTQRFCDWWNGVWDNGRWASWKQLRETSRA